MLKKYSGNILTNCFTRTEKREEKTNGKRQKTFFFDLGTKKKPPTISPTETVGSP